MTKGLDITITFSEVWYDEEYHDDWRLYSAGLFEEYLFMISPTSVALSYFFWKGWRLTSCPYENEIRLYNYSVNMIIGIRSFFTDKSDCWRVTDIWWHDCVTICPRTMHLN